MRAGNLEIKASWEENPPLVRGFLSGILIFSVAFIGGIWAREFASNSAIWFANAVILSAMLRARGSEAFLYYAVGLIALLLANIASGNPLSVSSIYVFANAAEIICAFLLVAHFVGYPTGLRDVKSMLLFLVLAGAIAPLAGAPIGAWAVSTEYGLNYFEILKPWYLSDALGILLLGPFCLRFGSYIEKLSQQRSSFREPAVNIAAVTIFSYLVFQLDNLSFIFFVHPFILWAAVRLGTLETALGGLILSVIAIDLTLGGSGPLAQFDADTMNRIELLQIYLTASILPALIVAVSCESRKRTELERDLRGEILEKLHEAIITSAADKDGEITGWNKGAARLWGYTEKEVIGKHYDLLYAENEPIEPIDKVLNEIQESGYFEAERRFRRKSGEEFIGRVTVSIISARDDGPDRIVAVVTDISERKAYEERLRVEEFKSRKIVESIQDGLFIAREKHAIYVNERMCKLLGRSREELLAMDWLELIHPDDREIVSDKVRRRYAGENPHPITEIRYLRADGQVLDAVTNLVLAESYPGGPALIGTFKDISDRKRHERTLRREEEKSRKILESLQDGLYIIRDERFIHVNDKFCKMVGRTREDLLAIDAADVVHPDQKKILRDRFARRMSGEKFSSALEYRVPRPDGAIVYAMTNTVLAADYPGGPAIIGTAQDITERKLAEDAIRVEKERAEKYLDIAANIVLALDTDCRITLISPSGCRFLECEQEDVLGKDWIDLFITEMEADKIRAVFLDCVSGRGEFLEAYENDIVTKEGNCRTMRWHNALLRDANGKISGVLSAGIDITEARRLEQQLQRSQKMEAVGQLTGGVAHDFNNILAVVYGNLALLRDILQEDEKIDREEILDLAQSALRASSRGADLTKQLLAFSRKQKLVPKIADIDVIVSNMVEMLRRTLGENIELVVQLREKDHWLAKVDYAQLENAILNLALNSRDAMPDGGELTIKIDNVSLEEDDNRTQLEIDSGDYVTLSVKDTGTGMSQEVQEKAFEPFFTTKEQGKGSGLGLSMIYGFVKQSGGQVGIQNEPEHGLSVTIFLPRVAGVLQSTSQPDKRAGSISGSEIVLLVEDDPNVRKTGVKILSRLGYKVIEAPDGQEALSVLDRNGIIDILFSDIVMPGGIDGIELAKRAIEGHPELKVLLTTGHAKEVVKKAGTLGHSFALIEKPYAPDELGQKLRELLAQDTQIEA